MDIVQYYTGYKEKDWIKSDIKRYKYMIDVSVSNNGRIQYETPKNPEDIFILKKSDRVCRLYANKPIEINTVEETESFEFKHDNKKCIKVEDFEFISDLNDWLKNISQEDFIDVKKCNNSYLLIYKG